MWTLGYRAVLADAGAWIRDDAPITVEDILLSLVLALFPEGQPDDTVAWLKEYAQRTLEFLRKWKNSRPGLISSK